MPEQEFPPLRRPARSYRPDRDDEDPPPWADLPPVRPARSHRAPAGGNPVGPGAGPAVLTSPTARIPGLSPVRAGPPIRLRTNWIRSGPSSGRSGTSPRRTATGMSPPARPRVPGGRALRAAARRRRRWFVMAASLVAVAGAVLAVVLLTGGGPGPAAVTPGALITTFQPGELRQVPDACRAVPGATVQQYLPGKPKVASPLPVNGSAGSACNWTIDKPPLYRLMELSLLAYAPNGLASGDGSATFAATDAYSVALQDLQSPPKHSPAPRATVTVLSGLGNQAFSALQVYRVGGAVTDVATVMVRYHNVVVTVTLNGLAHSNRGNYGPVSPSQLAAAAMAFAQAAEASLH